ncbi:MAG: NTP pyrophosphatase (non-canonical NTP hydrolase) [Saprospiraceae bacterium]|jgi:NTP pyrophosphatase (non-canonical NTP hydrolase)
MSIQEYQDSVDKWIKEYGVRYFDEKTNMLLLTEEVGELSRLIARKYGEQSFKKSEDADNVDLNIGEEISDIFFVLTCLSNQMGIDITESINKNFQKKTNRDSQRHKSNEKLT